MKITRLIMGMPVTIICPDKDIALDDIEPLWLFLGEVDERYSPYKSTSEVAAVNRGSLKPEGYSEQLAYILELAESTKQQTRGYFNVWHNDVFDPSGIIKGWAIQKAADMLSEKTHNFYIEIAGDIQVSGVTEGSEPWRIGVRNPLNRDETISVVSLGNKAIATSGTAIRGDHIYNPIDSTAKDNGVLSLSVIADKIIDADQFATAAFAMGKKGIAFIESLNGFEGFMVDTTEMVTKTTGWNGYEIGS